jgi:hypothetical protein
LIAGSAGLVEAVALAMSLVADGSVEGLSLEASPPAAAVLAALLLASSLAHLEIKFEFGRCATVKSFVTVADCVLGRIVGTIAVL